MPCFSARRASARPMDTSCTDLPQSSHLFIPKAYWLQIIVQSCTLLMVVGVARPALWAQANNSIDAQSSASGASGELDRGIPVPDVKGPPGKKDILAVNEILAHLGAVGNAWTGMQGKGKITYGPTDATAYDATLSNLGGDKFRLDAQTKHGAMSIRIHGGVGKIKSGDGIFSSMPFDTAMAGIFPFERARLTNFPGPSGSLIDCGVTTIGGTELHRITLEVATLGRNPVTKSREAIATDLYFDPTSHLLVKSSTASAIADGRNVKFLFVVTYSDYRKVGNSMVPFRYTETMNGEPYWTLQLSDVQMNSEVPSTFFEF
jgi:hypothetical protein